MRDKITNWSKYPIVEADIFNYKFENQLKPILIKSEGVIVRGNGRCYGDASLNNNIISSLSFNRIIDLNEKEGIINCQAGVTLDKLLEVLVPKGWFLPVTPGTKFISIGGAVASDVHGKNHHKEGSFSQYIIDMRVMTHAGEILHCGPSNNQDLFQCTIGGMGLTGIILDVKFKLKRIESSFIKFRNIKAKNLGEAIKLFEENKHYTYSVAWIDCFQKGENLGRSILMLGEHASINDLPASLRKKPLKLPSDRKIKFPFNLPGFVLNSFSIKSFNFLYYRKQQKKIVDGFVNYDKFFYPLDSILDWNNMYGKRGFVQYQFVLPLETSAEGLQQILEEIRTMGMGSFLAVLKLFGVQNDLISFPMEGYTLALDFPIRKGLFEFLEKLDKLVIKYGGRIYLTKDARMRENTFWKTYPNAVKFVQGIKKYNPNFKFESLLSKRLALTK